MVVVVVKEWLIFFEVWFVDRYLLNNINDFDQTVLLGLCGLQELGVVRLILL